MSSFRPDKYVRLINVSSLQWKRAYAIDVPEVDSEHQTLFRLLHGLERGIAGGADDNQLQQKASELHKHLADHFIHEQRLMRTTGYPLYEWHRLRHASSRVNLRRLARHIARGDRASASAAIDMLGAWLKNHIRLADRMFAAYFRNYRRGQTALAS